MPPIVWESIGEDSKAREHMNLRNARFRHDPRPIDENCGCQTCKTISRSYIHHLLKAGELLAMQCIDDSQCAFHEPSSCGHSPGNCHGSTGSGKKELGPLRNF